MNEKAQVSKSYRKEIRKEMYYIKKYGIKSHLEKTHSNKIPKDYLKSLAGRINYVLMINNDDVEFLKYKQELKKF